MVTEAILEKLRLAYYNLAHEQCRKASAESSWELMKELDGYSRLAGDHEPRIRMVEYNEKEHLKVRGAYDRSILQLNQEVANWEHALSSFLGGKQ